jgi:peptide deformylase
MRRPWGTSADSIRIFDDAILRVPSRSVTDFGDSLQRLIARLLKVQKRHHAVGVAASQIGEPWDVFVINGSEIRRGGKPEVYVNARIVFEDGQSQDEEGCLSFPGVFIPIKRAAHVALAALDENGNGFEREATGLLARAYSHETDHLRGRLIIDRVGPNAREKVIAHMRRHARGQGGLP